jgi:hypothetical protein
MADINIIIPKRRSFDCPEGPVRGSLEDVFELSTTSKRGEEQIRQVWVIEWPVVKNVQYIVGKNYRTDLVNSPELVDDLRSLLGAEIDELQDEHGQFKLRMLVGRKADLMVAHIHNDKYEKPFVYVKGIYRPGTLLPEKVS